MIITAFTAAILSTLLVILGFRVAMCRRSAKIGTGDRGDKQLILRHAAHQNAVDNIPLALILLGLLEYQQAAPTLLLSLAVLLILARLAHAWGMSRHGGHSGGRFYGIVATWSVILILAGANAVMAATRYLGSGA